MNEHPDIEELLSKELSDAVKEHVENCDVCSPVYEDIQLLDLNLKDLNEPIEIPDSINQEVYADISKRSKHIRRHLFRKSLIASASAIAAVLLISFLIFTNFKAPETIVADVNNDGQVNVLDSLLLAQKIEAQNTDKEDDFNGDGLVNIDDLQIVKEAVVDLDRRTP